MRSPRRTMCAAVLGLECIVLGLVTPVLISVEGIDTTLALVIGLGMAVSAVVIAGMLRAEWAYIAGFVLQAVAVGVGFLVSVMFVLGAIFAALYTAAYLLGRRIEVDQAARAAGG